MKKRIYVRPRLSALSRRQTQNGIELDRATACELGHAAPAVAQIANVRLCQRCLDEVAAIARDSKTEGPVGRCPETVPFALRVAAA